LGDASPLSRGIGALFGLVRRCPRPEGVAAPYWSNIAVAIQERLNKRRLAPIRHIFDDSRYAVALMPGG
jgi:hypothetical protein